MCYWSPLPLPIYEKEVKLIEVKMKEDQLEFKRELL